MSKYVFLLLFHCCVLISFAQPNSDRFPLYNDSLPNDPYIQLVNHKLDSIRELLQSDQIQLDIIRLNAAYTIRKRDGSYVLQNPYSGDRSSAKDWKGRMTYSVASFEGKIIGISLYGFSRDSAYQEIQPYLPFGKYPEMYFDHDTLIYSYFSSYDPIYYMSMCTGKFSEYENYFKNGDYYSTVISQEMFCGCGYNYIITDKTLQKLRKKLRKKLSKQ